MQKQRHKVPTNNKEFNNNPIPGEKRSQSQLEPKPASLFKNKSEIGKFGQIINSNQNE